MMFRVRREGKEGLEENDRKTMVRREWSGSEENNGWDQMEMVGVRRK